MTVAGQRPGSVSSSWRVPEQPNLSPILSNALDAFYENGYHGTSVRDIAARAGLTVPALYYHHTNKEAILYALLDSSIMTIIERCEHALADGGSDPVQRFLNLVECQVSYVASNVKSAAMDAEIRSLSEEKHRAYSTHRRVVERMMVRAIEDGVAAGSFDVTDAATTARALLGMIQAIGTWFKARGRFSPQTVAREYVGIAARAVGGSPEVLARARGMGRG